MKRKIAVLLCVFLVLVSAACGKKETAAETLTEPEKAVTEAVTEEKEEETVIYESDTVKVVLEDLLEDSTYYHVRVKADSVAEEELNLEFLGFAFNGITVDNSYMSTLPPGGNSYMDVTFEKEQLAAAGISSMPGRMTTTVGVFDTDYVQKELKTVDLALPGEDRTPDFDVKEEVYDGEELKLSSLGIVSDDFGYSYVRLLAENKKDVPLVINGGTAMAPGEVLCPSLYGVVLPGTKAVICMTFYTEDCYVSVDPASLPFAACILSAQVGYEGESMNTEPFKLTLGEEGRYSLSADGKTLVLKQHYFHTDGDMWTAVSADGEILTVEEITVKEDAPEEGYEEATVTVSAKKPGTVDLSVYCHAEGTDPREAEEYDMGIYASRTYTLTVKEDGTIEPGGVFLETPWGPETWYYFLDKDGNVLSRDTAAG